MSKDLFKEAIADAKAVKEAAINNAKLALEEAFTPHLRSVLAAKLEQLDEVEEMGDMEDKKMKEMKDEKEGKDNLDELDLEEILKELESLEEMGDEGEDKKKQDDLKETYYEDSEEEGTEEDTEEEFDLENMDINDLKKVIEDVVGDMMANGELEGAEDEEGDEEAAELAPIDELDINELLAEIEEMEKKETMDEPVNEMVGEAGIVMAALAAAAGIPVTAFTVAKLQDLAKDGKLGTIGTKVINSLEKAGKATSPRNTGGGTGMEEAMKDEMEETINELKKELNEVNLLNAKLLYTNKIFKAKNLTESEKIKVLSTFDKATTVKETKLVYETLLEGLSAKTKSPIKESLGSASKAMGVAKKQPIIETNEVFARMQKLAGIK
jgi:hypothetical protein